MSFIINNEKNIDETKKQLLIVLSGLKKISVKFKTNYIGEQCYNIKIPY